MYTKAQSNSNKFASRIGRDVSSGLNRTIDEFDSRSFYSGADIRMEFDGISIPGVVALSYKVIEPVQFYYGYASYTRQKVSRGQRIIQGQLLTNFKDPTQLYYVLDKIKNGDTLDTSTADYQSKQKVYNVLAGGADKNNILELLSGKKAPSFYQNSRLSQGVPDRLTVEQFRDAVWGVSEKSDLRNNQGAPQYNPKYNSRDGGFDLRMIFGEPGLIPELAGDMAGRAVESIGAVILLSGVEIMGESLQINDTGSTIQYAYDFVAADVN